MTTRKNRDTDIKRVYFRWLCDLVYIGGPGHAELLKMLYLKDFYWSIPNDDNRADDGIKLREKFASETLLNDRPSLDGACSVLEMLIALAQAMDFQLWENNLVGDRTAKWFWEMIDRLGLQTYTDDDEFEDCELKDELNQQKLDILLAREYSRRGEGGLFPLSGRPINGRIMPDQRKVELWYQLNYYIIENYNN